MMTRSLTTTAVLTLLLLVGCAEPASEVVATEPAPAPVASAPTVSPLIAIKNARVPLDGVLTGGQLTAEQLESAAAAGYRTVINLRSEGEDGYWDEAPKAEELGMRFIAIPVAGVEGLTVDAARQLGELVDDESLRPLLVHCASGNRVGALLAMKAFHLEGADAETALAMGRAAGLTKLEPVVAEMLVQPES